MDRVVGDLADTKGMATAAGKDADQAGRLADQANRAVIPLQDALQEVSKELEALGRQGAQDRREIGRALDDLAGARDQQERAVAEALRDIQQKADRLGRENGVEKLRQLIDDLSDRTDENFRTVEESARAVDNELTRQSNELNTLQGELVALEDRNRNGLNLLGQETDEKYNALLNAFREYERNSSELEEHLAMAGQALARRRRSPPRGSR
ncbi:hypothetical protein AGDE_02985 [Angomonas deanei]|nr:hypothetical protein AGDE_02985 [Angomonas deanei]|eukprot:EPY40940.1 hypothetical protein AGDE_02985 [Angomonas deanei]